MREGKLSPGAARAIVGHENVDVLAEEIVARGLTVREVETLVAGTMPAGCRRHRRQAAAAVVLRQAREPRDKDADTKAFEKDLSDSLGLSVEVQRGSGESGR